MKLETKHILPYLDNNLKVKMLYFERDYVGKEIVEIIGIHQWSKGGNLWSVLTVGGSKPSLDRIKPFLRPLSSLTKEITHNGETFVPIVELAKIGTKESRCYITNSNDFQCYVDASNNRKGFFMYHPSKYFLWQVGKNADQLHVNNQYTLFEKLAEWHFDFAYNLIENGLAEPIKG